MIAYNQYDDRLKIVFPCNRYNGFVLVVFVEVEEEPGAIGLSGETV